MSCLSLQSYLGFVILTFSILLLTGCQSRYVTPGRPANMSSFTHTSIADRWDAKPAAVFPVSIATVRVQASGYRAHGTTSYGYGNYTVISTREIEGNDKPLDLTQLTGIAGISHLNRLLLSQELNSDVELREAAASLQADMLLIYTLDTTFRVDEKIPYAGALTLGLLPDREARVVATASALLIDTRTGFVYGTAEATADKSQIASLWTSDDAVDQTRREAEREAYTQMLEQFTEVWPAIYARYGGS